MDSTKFPPYVSARDLTRRTLSSLRMLSKDEKLSFEKMVDYMHSTHLELTDRILGDLLTAAQETAATRGLKNTDVAIEALAKAAAEVEKNYGKLDVAYGDVNRFKFRGANLPGNGADGALGAFRVIRYGPPAEAKERSPMHGDTFVACVEWLKSGPHAQVLVSYGHSFQPGTMHAVDQLPFLSQKRLRKAWRLRKEVEAHLESIDAL